MLTIARQKLEASTTLAHQAPLIQRVLSLQLFHALKHQLHIKTPSQVIDPATFFIFRVRNPTTFFIDNTPQTPVIGLQSRILLQNTLKAKALISINVFIGL